MTGDIRLNHLRFAYPDNPMYFDGKITAGSITMLTGPSGAGKSTLLNLIAGFETPLSGDIEIDGRSMAGIPPSKRPVAMLFQDHNLFMDLSVEANIGLGISPDLKLTNEQHEQVRQALVRTGLDGKGNRRPSQLSGGERQRAAFARILVQSKPVLLLDEPFASLGPSLRTELMQLLLSLSLEKQLTVIAVTHHPQEWHGIASQFMFVEDGRIGLQGSMDDLRKATKSDGMRKYMDTAR